MSVLDEISKKDLVTVLNKNWMTHDAMWFSLTIESSGIEKANKINRKAARSMAMIEVKRMLRLLNTLKIADIQKLLDFLKNILSLFPDDILKGEYTIIGEDRLRFETKKCFAYEGMKKIGHIEKYECGIFERIEGWFDALQLKYKHTPPDELCVLHHMGSCIKEYKFTFK